MSKMFSQHLMCFILIAFGMVLIEPTSGTFVDLPKSLPRPASLNKLNIDGYLKYQGMASVHRCAASTEPIVISDPYPPELKDKADAWSIFYWNRFDTEDGNLVKKELFYKIPINGGMVITNKKYNITRISLHGAFGLKIEEPQVDDSMWYMIDFQRQGNGTEKYFKLYDVVVAVPPKLKSKKLTVDKHVDPKTGMVTLVCGTLDDLGTPPAHIYWKAPNGTKLNGTYKNGNLTVTLSAKEDTRWFYFIGCSASIMNSEGIYSCELDSESPATKCLSDANRDRFEGNYEFLKKDGGEASVNNTIIIIACVVASLVGLAVIIILSCLLCKRCKKQDGYNTKNAEAQKANAENGKGDGREGGVDATFPLMVSDDSNPYDRPNAGPVKGTRKPIYTPPPSIDKASPYMISGLNFEQDDNHRVPLNPPPKRNQAPFAARENTDISSSEEGNGRSAGKGRYTKRNNSKENLINSRGGGDRRSFGADLIDRRGDDIDGKEAPTPKKRSIFLTESNEALDRIAEAVAGGIGSGRDGGRAGEKGAESCV